MSSARRRCRRRTPERKRRSSEEDLPNLSEYRSMWLFALFDLPVDSKDARRQYAKFRKALLLQGFSMLQYSVYARHCATEDSSDALRACVKAALPPEGQVRLLGVTDRQFGKMDVFIGQKRRKTEEPMAQFVLF